MFDVNTAIGSWPFRRLKNNTLPELKDYLQSFGITHAAVTHNHAACYQNCHDANIELFEELSKDKSGFFVGIATINPTYAAWQRDLECCVKKFDLRGVRILPKYHNYRINSRAVWELCDEAAKYKIPVVIPNELVNCRQRFWMEPDEALGAGNIEMTSTVKLFQNKLHVYNAGRTAGNVNLISDPDQGKRSINSLECQHFISRL